MGLSEDKLEIINQPTINTSGTEICEKFVNHTVPHICHQMLTTFLHLPLLMRVSMIVNAR